MCAVVQFGRVSFYNAAADKSLDSKEHTVTLYETLTLYKTVKMWPHL